MKTKYKDINGNEISYGDILRWVHYKQPTEEQKQFAPKEPWLTIVSTHTTKNKMYISSMDEFTDISEWQTKEDKKQNKISSVEIFVSKDVYDDTLKYFLGELK